MTKPKHPWIIAHRGDSSSAPENTGAAFEAAAGLHADGIELDLQLSADGTPVAFHDRTLSRMGHGKREIGELNLKELKRLDFGSWFSPRYKGEKIITFEEIVRRFGHRVRLLVELKIRKGRADALRHRALLDKTLSIIHEKKLDKNVFILSFNKEILEMGYRLSPRLRYVLNAGFLPRFFGPFRENFFDPFHAVCVDIKVLTRPFVETLHRMGKKVFVYTCDTPRTVERAFRAGVDAIISNRPAWAAGHVKSLGA
jgi:glycerophosphoryl diester phosphodiesterase